MNDNELFNKIIDATSNVLTKIIEELKKFKTDINPSRIELFEKEKEKIDIKKDKSEGITSSPIEEEINMCLIIINSIHKVLYLLANDSIINERRWELKQKLFHLIETLNIIVCQENIREILEPILSFKKEMNINSLYVIEIIEKTDKIIELLNNYSSKSNKTFDVANLDGEDL
tara:strand:- start:12064 stop:12582 length:519 start_codon:yes stop_codon:yes gene_type:complete